MVPALDECSLMSLSCDMRYMCCAAARLGDPLLDITGAAPPRERVVLYYTVIDK